MINRVLMRPTLCYSVLSSIEAMPQDIYVESKVTFYIPRKAFLVNVCTPDVKRVLIFLKPLQSKKK